MRRDLIRHLAACLARQLSLNGLELWLVGHLQQIVDEGDIELQEYADNLDALLIQFGEGIISSVELDDAIEGILRNLETVKKEFVLTSRLTTTEGTAQNLEITRHFVDLAAGQDLRLPLFAVA